MHIGHLALSLWREEQCHARIIMRHIYTDGYHSSIIGTAYVIWNLKNMQSVSPDEYLFDVLMPSYPPPPSLFLSLPLPRGACSVGIDGHSRHLYINNIQWLQLIQWSELGSWCNSGEFRYQWAKYLHWSLVTKLAAPVVGPELSNSTGV
jgi:hypothetical protein